jgi:hypothetical protein
MGRAEVREAVAAYFAQANLENVGTVYPARPEILPEQAYNESMFGFAASSEHGSSAVLVVNIASDSRQRRADTGRGAVNDSLICKVVIEVFFASAGGEAVPAQEDYDGIIDSMITLVRANATLNAGTKIWSAGEYEAGVAHQQGEPFTDADGLVVFILGDVRFDAYQWIAGNV